MVNFDYEGNKHFGFSIPPEVQEAIEEHLAETVYGALINGDIKSDAYPKDVIKMIDILLQRFEKKEAYEKCKILMDLKHKYEKLCC